MKIQNLKTLLIFSFILFYFFKSFAQQESSVITAKSPENLYLGAVFEQNNINSNQHDILNIIQDDIVASFSTIGLKSKTIRADKNEMYKMIDEALRSSNNTKWQNKSFSFDVKELKAYRELDIFFGQSLDLNTWFSIPEQSNKLKTLLVINIERVAFTIDMDLPTDGVFKTNSDLLAKYNINDLIYASTLSFGRRAIIIIESNLDPSKVKYSLSKILKKETMSEHDNAILANCKYRIVLLGGDSSIELDSKRPIQQVIEYIETEITSTNYGLPISFGASYLKNHQLFINKY